MSYYRLLSSARAHQGIRWIQKLLHTNPWYIKHTRHYPSVSLSGLGTGNSLHLGFTACSIEPSFVSEFRVIQLLFVLDRVIINNCV